MTASHHRATFSGVEHTKAIAPDIDLRCHRRLRGPYTGGGALIRRIVPDLLEIDPELVGARATEVIALAPDLAPLVPIAPQTLTNLANRAERTRFYAVARTLRIANGVAELLTEWASRTHPGGVVIAFREVDEADGSDRELLSVLLRRCDPGLVTLVVEADRDGADDDPLDTALIRYTDRVAMLRERREPPVGTDLAQWFIDSDGTSDDLAVLAAYERLPEDERAARHSARATALIASGDQTVRLGAVLFHLERGADLVAAREAFVAAVEECFDRGVYQASLEFAQHGRALHRDDERPMTYWDLTNKIGACLSYLGRGVEGFAYFDELRAGSIAPGVHMNACYMMAMLYTRHLPKGDHDEIRALQWVNTAIAIADQNPDVHKRAFVGAFMRNARALVEMHRGDLPAALDLVNEAIAMTDADLGPNDQLLHRSVLRYNRAQILSAQGDHVAALLDYDEVVRRDPDYGDYYFERANTRRSAGLYAEALADYAEAVRLSPPVHETHFNRADLLRQLGDEEGALRDLDYAIEVEPDFADSRLNRADLLLALGELERARIDIEYGLHLEPGNANLLSAKGALLDALGDTDAAYACYTEALAADPDLAATWSNRAVLAYSSGRAADAVADLDRAITIEDGPTLRGNRGIVLQDLGEHRRAIDDFDVAIAGMDELDPELLYRRGVSRHAMADLSGAVEDWQAHLAVYSDGESPFLADIELRSSGRVTMPERVG